MKAPEKFYYAPYGDIREDYPITDNDIEYIRKDAFIEKVLKWYCLDCACNDNCAANRKCFFRQEYKRYLEGNDKALPPKISNAFNPDGSTTENYRYRHLIRRMQDAFIEKVCKWLEPNVKIILCGDKIDTNKFIENFKTYMKGE